MAEPDWVARGIAAFAALAAIANSSTSMATFKRKRPRVDFDVLMRTKSRPVEIDLPIAYDAFLDIRYRNKGETPLTVAGVQLQGRNLFRPKRWSRPGTFVATWPLKPDERYQEFEAPFEIDGFGDARWIVDMNFLVVEKPQAFVGLKHFRVVVRLRGDRRVYSRWMKASVGWRKCAEEALSANAASAITTG